MKTVAIPNPKRSDCRLCSVLSDNGMKIRPLGTRMTVYLTISEFEARSKLWASQPRQTRIDHTSIAYGGLRVKHRREWSPRCESAGGTRGTMHANYPKQTKTHTQNLLLVITPAYKFIIRGTRSTNSGINLITTL